MAEHAGEGGVVRVPLAPPIAPDPRSSLLAGEIAAAASYRRRAKSANTTRAYIRSAELFEDHAGEGFL